jgi:hypothetical protein
VVETSFWRLVDENVDVWTPTNGIIEIFVNLVFNDCFFHEFPKDLLGGHWTALIDD